MSKGRDTTESRYAIRRPLGQGGMGEVYLARDLTLGREVAIKRVRGGDAEDRARLEREARQLAKVSHPNVVMLFDAGVDEDGVFVVMEYLRGTTLSRHVGKPEVPLAQRLAWLEALAAGLQALHVAGLVHRDVKPANVMVTDAGVVKLLDLGLSRAPTSATQSITDTGVVVGTPRYMAPEQHLGTTLDPRTDQYGWGCLAYELLTGRPFGPSWRQEGTPLLPAAAIAVLERALAPTPDARFPSVTEAARALGVAFARAPAAPVRGSAPVAAASGPVRRSTVFLTALGATIGILALGGSGALVASRPPWLFGAEPGAAIAPSSGVASAAPPAPLQREPSPDEPDASPGVVADASPSPVTAPRRAVPSSGPVSKGCLCIATDHARYGSAALCHPAALTPARCECAIDAVRPLCWVPFRVTTPDALDTFSSCPERRRVLPGAREGDRCRGHPMHSAAVDGGYEHFTEAAIDAVIERCWRCEDTRLFPREPGAPCLGVYAGTGDRAAGTVSCR